MIPKKPAPAKAGVDTGFRKRPVPAEAGIMLHQQARAGCRFEEKSSRSSVELQQEADLLQVLVRDNNVEQALRVLKKKMQREGVFREMKRRRFYEKPSEKATRERAEAVRRARKLARKKLQREGLIAAPKRKLADRPGGRPRFPGEAAPSR
jgi:small subunit ribosomal protein S21